MEITHRHERGGRTEAEFDSYSNGELSIHLEYIASNCYQSADVSITLSKSEVERLLEEIEKSE